MSGAKPRLRKWCWCVKRNWEVCYLSVWNLQSVCCCPPRRRLVCVGTLRAAGSLAEVDALLGCPLVMFPTALLQDDEVRHRHGVY